MAPRFALVSEVVVFGLTPRAVLLVGGRNVNASAVEPAIDVILRFVLLTEALNARTDDE